MDRDFTHTVDRENQPMWNCLVGGSSFNYLPAFRFQLSCCSAHSTPRPVPLTIIWYFGFLSRENFDCTNLSLVSQTIHPMEAPRSSSAPPSSKEIPPSVNLSSESEKHNASANSSAVISDARPALESAEWKPSKRLYVAFLTLAVITLMVALDGTSLSVALPVSAPVNDGWRAWSDPYRSWPKSSEVPPLKHSGRELRFYSAPRYSNPVSLPFHISSAASQWFWPPWCFFCSGPSSVPWRRTLPPSSSVARCRGLAAVAWLPWRKSSSRTWSRFAWEVSGLASLAACGRLVPSRARWSAERLLKMELG